MRFRFPRIQYAKVFLFIYLIEISCLPHCQQPNPVRTRHARPQKQLTDQPARLKIIDMHNRAKRWLSAVCTNIIVAGLLTMSFASGAIAETEQPQAGGPRSREEPSSFQLLGPSVHFGAGARFRKAPNLDVYDSPVGALRVSAMSLKLSDETYVALLAPGVSYVGELRFAFMLTPVILSHISGVGLGFDLFATRADRLGGPYSVTLNFDVLGMIRYFTAAR